MKTHLQGFGLENFRVFKDHTYFDFAPITVLTGPNNSGKSSLNKALLLMKDNYERGSFPLTWKKFLLESLKFDNPIHGLGGGKTSINEQSTSDVFSFSFGVSHQIFENPIYIRYSFVNKAITRFLSFVELFDKNEKLIFRITRESMYLDLPLILKKFPNNFLELNRNNYEQDETFTEWCNSIGYEGEGDVDDFFGLYLIYFSELFQGYEMEKWQNEIYFEDYYNANPMSFLVVDDEERFNKKILLPYSEYRNFLLGSLSSAVSYFFYANGIDLSVSDDSWIEKYIVPSDQLTWEECRMKALFGILEIFVFNVNENWQYGAGLKEKFPNLSLIQYLPSIKGQLRRSFQVNDEHTLNTLIKEVNEKKLTPESTKFVNKWVKAYEMDEIKIESDESLGVNYIKFKNKSLLDLGFGISQLTAILLKIALSPESILILEEPEANLHPNFQSKLADMLVEAAETFDMQFIVETHSEYLIRKLQYLTAKQKINPNDTVIYYFHDSNHVPMGEKQVKKIEIQSDGSLSSDFGSGFFDEADNLAISLFNLKNRKN